MEQISAKSQYEFERNKPTPSKNHAFTQGNLFFVLKRDYSRDFKVLPEINILFGEAKYVPDIGLFKDVEFTPGNDDINITETPIGLIEILSPKQSIADLLIKSKAYFENGVQSYWLVIPDLRSIYVYHQYDDYTLFAKEDKLTDEKLNISVALKEIFY